MNIVKVKSFEESINITLKGETKRNALDFAAFLKANDLATGETHGTVVYKDNVFAYLHMDGKPEMPGPWTIWPDLDGTVPDGFTLDDSMKEIAWKHVNICADCGSGCAPGSSKTIYGKEFENVCGAILAFTDPDSQTLECVKKLMELRKQITSTTD